MSQYMQLSVKVVPHYREDLKAAYPKIAAHLGNLHESPLDENPSLYAIIAKLDQLLYALDGNPGFKQILLKHK